MSETKYVVAPMSMAHTFGNVTAFETEFLKNLFPNKYFRTVNIASQIAFKYFNIFDNTNREFIKKQKPMMLIRPRIDATDSDIFLSGTALTSRLTNNISDLDFGNLQPFIDDNDKGFSMMFLLNRVRMYFDVNLVFESQMEQINQFMYLKNRIRQDHPFFIKTALESNIPYNLMKIVAKQVGIDIKDTKALLDYLNARSVYPITYKMKNSTGQDEFFRYYPAEIDTTYTNLNMDDGSKKGFVGDAYNISFTVQTEFFTAGLYYFFTRQQEIIKQVDMDFAMDGGNTLVPIFTVSNLFDVTPPAGWNLYAAPMFKVENDNLEDILDLEPLLNMSIKSAIRYNLDKGVPLTTLLNVAVLKDNVKLDPNPTAPAIKDYEIDYGALELKLSAGVANKTSTYRMVVYVNTLYINNLVSSIYNISNEK